MAHKKKNKAFKDPLPQQSRLRLANKWIEGYTGKNAVRGYAKHFRVDKLCAIKELRLSGCHISEQYELALKQSIAAAALGKARKQQRAELENYINSDADENFEFIAGYTSGGAPYGTPRQITENDSLPDDLFREKEHS